MSPQLPRIDVPMALLTALLTVVSIAGCSSMRDLAHSDPERASRMAIRALRSSDRDRRQEGAEILGETGAVNAEVVAALAAALGDKSQDVRWRAARSLKEIGPSAAGAIPALIDALLHPECAKPWILRECASALGAIGPTARQALPVLSRRLKDGGPEVRICAAGAIGAMAHARCQAPRGIVTGVIRTCYECYSESQSWRCCSGGRCSRSRTHFGCAGVAADVARASCP